MDLGLEDRAFVVTAASSGLGRSAAEQLVAEGARVVLVARRAEMLAEAVSRMGPDRAVALAADVTDLQTAETACAFALDAFGRLDGALISVGGPPAGSVMDTGEEAWRGAFESVFLAALRVSKAVVRHGTASDLVIAWVLSTSVKTPMPGLATSNGLRPGLAMLVKQLADELDRMAPESSAYSRAASKPSALGTSTRSRMILSGAERAPRPQFRCADQGSPRSSVVSQPSYSPLPRPT
jgi:3-oxoacyl-[acyl-carrier protein] reductase